MHSNIRRKRLISKSDYNLSLDAPKSILEAEKNPKNSLFWANIFFLNQKNQQQKPKNQK